MGGEFQKNYMIQLKDFLKTEYQKGKVRILAATNAFGMGVDHPDVRLVVHAQMPANTLAAAGHQGRLP